MQGEQTLEEMMEQRRKDMVVLQEFRQRQHKVEAQRMAAEDCRSNTLRGLFLISEYYQPEARTAHQALVDTQTFQALGRFARKQAEKMICGVQDIDVESFTNALLAVMRKGINAAGEMHGTPAINLFDVGDAMHGRWRSAPSQDFMHGNEPRDVSVRRQRRAVAQKGSLVERAQEMKTRQLEQTETDRQVAEMGRELARRGSCNFWVFVLDPHDFARSVENLFHSTFLVKDRLAALDLSKETPVISYIDPSAGGGRFRDGAARGEEIVGFDPRTWAEMKVRHKVTRSLFPRPGAKAERGCSRQLE